MPGAPASGCSNKNPRTKYPQPDFKSLKSQAAPGTDQEKQLNALCDWGEDTYQGSNKLTNKTAVVTGGDSGIGKAVCIAYAKEGAKHIVISYLNEHKDAEETKRIVEKFGCSVLLVPGDISTDKGCKSLITEATKFISQIDILVLNAAYQGKALDHPFDVDYDRVSHTFHTNIISMFAICKYAHPYLKAGSSIITTSSIQGYQPAAKLIDYACTKAAIVAFTKSLGQELIKESIRVNSVAPGPILTPLIPASFSGETLESFGSQAPIGRPGQPVEMAAPFVWLASEESSYIVASVISATGGDLTA